MAVFNFSEATPGKQWPPPTEQVRVASYLTFDRWYRGEHQLLESENRMPIHWFRRLSEVWAEMLFASPPELRYSGNARVQEWLDSLHGTLMAVAFDAAIDVSRYGTAILRAEAYMGELLLSTERPAFYVPVVRAEQVEKRIGDIFHYPYNPKPLSVGDAPDHLRLVLHDFRTGDVHTRTYGFDGQVIGDARGGSATLRGVNYPRSVQIANGRRDNGWGESDYIAIAPLIAEMEERLQGVSSVLDRHTDPHLAAPDSSVVVDASGNADLAAQGSVFPMGEGEVPPQYIVWDGKLEANFEQVQWCQDLLFAMSGLSAAMFSGRKNLGTIESGVALRSRYLASHLKLEGLRRRFEEGLRGLLVAASRETAREPEMESVAFNPMDLSFGWEDVFPATDDPATGEGALGAASPTPPPDAQVR